MPMISVLTLCSANYIAHAQTLGDSLTRFNPKFHFIIGLVDRIPVAFKAPSYEVIPVEELNIPDFAEMVQRYDVVELNTAVKPFYIEYLYTRTPAIDAVVYLDPDIMVYGPFDDLVRKLEQNNIVLTPHSCTYDDTSTVIYYETGMLSGGIYNLGFVATRRSETTFRFLRWWQRRLREYCYYEPGSGLFVDQLWVTLAPLYFEGVYVEKNPGYNMCYWNHFERRLSRADGRYIVNGKYDLIFYHFSSYSADHPDVITKRAKSKSASFSERPDLRAIYDEYRDRLLANGYAGVKALRYSLRSEPFKSPNRRRFLAKNGARAALRRLPVPCRRLLRALAQFTMNTFKTTD